MVQVGFLTPRRFAAPRVLLLGLLASLVGAASLSAVPAAASPAAPPPVRHEDRGGDHLTVTVRHAGGGRDGTYELYCHPVGGSHPHARGACDVLDRNTRWGREVFAPVPDDSLCTMQYGGPATAHVTGTWAGRPVDAYYDRGDGCRIDRWNRLVPLLPDLGAPEGSGKR
ncbi:SSI family serine proteinase inhibitor [Streptomyces kebangsaanensis]|uniref:SSI family serine proteinase inhibitor n=1 Tax=Streptomyces kebangsaanensis TaxID=864058 RepID=A0ABW6KVQ5_9ACTN|nr:SSI family serine proteinase inhibitor [Streptomyces kebangsaanensis]